MAQDDSRLQELLNMQNTANMPTSPTPDQPSGQFSGDDIEFEAFMFDPGTGPLAPSAAMFIAADAPSSAQVPPLQPVPASASAFEITGGEVPIPPYLRTSQSQPLPQEQEAEQSQPNDYQPHSSPRGTGPLGGVHTTSHLSARLAQSQEQASAPEPPIVLGTGPLLRRITGQLDGATTDTSDPSGGGYSTPPTVPATGPINPYYFSATTGPLNSALLRRAAEQAEHSHDVRLWPTTWNDNALADIEDFSTVLLSMYATRPSSIDLLPDADTSAGSTATHEAVPTADVQVGQNWGEQASAYSATNAPELEEPPASEGLYTEVSQPGWGEMTGAPPASDYSHSYEQVAAPDYDGPEMGYVVPMEEPVPVTLEQPGADYAEMRMQQVKQEEATPYNSINPNDLQFEDFMFNEGEAAVSPVGPPLPDMEEFMPSVVSMEAAFEQPTPATPPYSAAAPDRDTEPKLQALSSLIEEEPAPFDPAMQLTVAPEQYMSPPESSHTQEAESTSVAQEISDAQTQASDQGPLPFWLQDTSDLQAIARQGYVNIDAEPEFGQPDASLPLAMQSAAPPQATSLEASAQGAIPAPVHTEDAIHETASPNDTTANASPPFNVTAPEPPTAEYAPAEPQIDEVQDQGAYGGLPPIEPFDFASLGLVAEEEKLGFNTEELTGIMPSRHDPMRATADLDVLADIFDGMPVGSPLDVKPAFLKTSPLDALTLGPEAEQDLEEQYAHSQTAGSDTGSASGSWTSMVTTSLSVDMPNEYGSFETGIIGATSSSSTESLPDLETDVEPFDFTQLNLEQEDELSTGMLQTGSGAQSPHTVSTWGEGISGGEASEGGDEESWRGTEHDTSLFLPTSSRLTDDGVPDAASRKKSASKGKPAPQQPPVGQSSEKAGLDSKGVKARVARTTGAVDVEPSSTHVVQDSAQTRAKKALAPLPTASTAPAPSEPAYDYQPMRGDDAAAGPRVETPRAGTARDIYTSGPLPKLEGFEALRVLVDNNPDDIGAHIALAAAYTQLGDFNTALRVYRRVLKKRTVSDSILRLITEELNDLDAELQGNAKYHQVRGALYTRQGRHQEAVREYNKIV